MQRKVTDIYNIRFWILLVTLTFISPVLMGQRGLEFASHEVDPEYRTMLDLSPEKYFQFHEDFRLRFDLKLQGNLSRVYGYVFRMSVNDSSNIDLLIEKESSAIKMMIVHGDSLTNIQWLDEDLKLAKGWHQIDVAFDISNDELILFIDSLQFKHKGIGVEYGDDLKILFGANDYLHYATSDVPPMSITNIEIVEGKDLKHHWTFFEGHGVNSKDSINGLIANISKPKWSAQNYRHWSLVTTRKVSGHVPFTYSASQNTLYIAPNNTLITENLSTGQFDSFSFQKSLNVNARDRLIFDDQQQRLFSYSYDSRTVNQFNFVTRRWDSSFPDNYKFTGTWQHNSFYSDKLDKIFLFGGYGKHTYKNQIATYSIKGKEWSVLTPDDDQFEARYLAGLGSNPKRDSVYIIGGFGSKRKKQALNPRTFYDVNLFLPETGEIKEISTIEMEGKDYCFASRLVIDEQQNFYALVHSKNNFKGHLYLIKGNVLEQEIQFLADSIPYSFVDIKSTAELHLNETEQKLYAFTSYFNERRGLSTIRAYAIGYPPMAIEPVSQTISESQDSSILYPVLLSGLGIFLVVLILIYKKQKSQRVSEPPKSNPEPVAIKETTNKPIAEIPKKNCILLFGGWQVFNREGEEITGKFTPLQKELFLFILLKSLRYEKGIASNFIDETFWFDMPTAKAGNNRSVNLYKIKLLLGELDGCSLNNDKGSWMADVDKNLLNIDYLAYLDLVREKQLSTQSISILQNLAQKGKLLPNMEYEWLDKYKADTSNSIIDAILRFIRTLDLNKDQDLIINLTNTINLFDPIHEVALKHQCLALVKLGKHSIAKDTYQRFIKEYKILYAEDYETSFQELIKTG
ncbi:MAG: hypothetical protein JXR07_16665 [Reichenbachiella sp.]